MQTAYFPMNPVLTIPRRARDRAVGPRRRRFAPSAPAAVHRAERLAYVGTRER